MSKKKTPKAFIEELQKNPETRECLLYCYNCHESYSTSKEVYNYWAFVNWRDVEARVSPITQKRVAITYCVHCGKREARIQQVKGKNKQTLPSREERLEALKEKQDLNEKKWEDKVEKNAEDYARQEGKQALKKDFLQPFHADGTPNLEYAQTYPEQIRNQYDEADIKSLEEKDIAISKYLLNNPEEEAKTIFDKATRDD